MKPSWDEYYINLAHAASLRSSCERSKVGAVVVNEDHIVVSLGYNDSPAGAPGCESCPRRISDCATGSSYDNCVSIHAEQNALLFSSRESRINSTIYVTKKPCITCKKLISGSGITRIVWSDIDGITEENLSIRRSND